MAQRCTILSTTVLHSRGFFILGEVLSTLYIHITRRFCLDRLQQPVEYIEYTSTVACGKVQNIRNTIALSITQLAQLIINDSAIGTHSLRVCNNLIKEPRRALWFCTNSLC